MVRPKKSTTELNKNWQQIIIDLAKVGGSEVEMRVAIGYISDDFWYRLKDEDEEFSRTIKQAKLISEAWWLEQGRTNLQNPKFKTQLWQLNMMNRFGKISLNDRLPQPILDVEPLLVKFIDSQDQIIDAI